MSNPHHTLTQDSRIFHHPHPQPLFSLFMSIPPHPDPVSLSPSPSPFPTSPTKCPHPTFPLPWSVSSCLSSKSHSQPWISLHPLLIWASRSELCAFFGVFFFWFNRFRIFFFFYYLISFFSSHMIFRFSLWVFVRESFFWVWSFVCYFLLLSRCTFLYLDG